MYVLYCLPSKINLAKKKITLADLPPFSQSKQEGLLLHSVRGLEETSEEGEAVELVGRHVAGELLEPDLRWLPSRALHSSQAAMEG
jgi:hypothetical protein